MHRVAHSASTRFAVQPLAIAAAAALLLTAGFRVQAQSFTQSGANSTTGPVSLLPYAGDPASLNFGTETIYIGNSAPGSFSALAGAQLSAGALSIANGGLPYVPANPATGAPASGSYGDVTFTGVNPSTLVPTTVLLGGIGNRLEVGNWGTGTLTVSGGALLDATVNAAACSAPGGNCYNFIGNAAGSTGTLTVTGAGSEVRTLRNFTVGQTAVFTNPPNDFTFGTLGGTTNANLNVLAGGKLFTEGAVIGSNNASPNGNGNGNERANGTVVVDGAGSKWTVTHNSVDNVATGMFIGRNAGGTGSLTIQNGGAVNVDATNAVAGANDFINLGQDGGNGTLTVTGAGSTLELVRGGTIQAGRSNSAGGTVGEGSFSVLAGASVSATFLNAGRAGAKGTVLLDGAGSQLTLSGLGTYSSGAVGPAGAVIGGGGSGNLTVSNSAQLLIKDGGANTSTGPGSPFLDVGIAGGSGKMFIDGLGSRVDMVSTSIAPAASAPDNYNPYMVVGRETGTSGELTITNGGKLQLTGNALSTNAFNRGTNFYVGGDNDTVAGGTGTAAVSGAGSEIRVQGADVYIAVGRNGNGTLNLSDQARVVAIGGGMNVGRATSGVGTLNVDRSFVELSGQFTSSNIGAFLALGSGGGRGTANITNGSVVAISNAGSAGAALILGGASISPGGRGELSLRGGSKINVVAAPGLGSMTVGYDGTGISTITGAGSEINLGDGTLHVGRQPTGVGTLNIQSGGKLMAGLANIGGSSDVVTGPPAAGTPGGTGTATVSGAGSELRVSGPAAFIGVGRSGVGTLNVNNGGTVASTAMSVGRGIGGSGTLNVDGGLIDLSGQQTAGNLVGATLAIGLGQGIGVANITNSTVNIVNATPLATSAGANLIVGGSTRYPLGEGTLVLAGSQVNVSAANGLAAVTIGNDGKGTATLSAASSINVGGGSAYVARQAGSTGALNMSGNSVLNADFVGIGVNAKYNAATGQSLGGIATLVLNDSTINTKHFELGAGSTLSGNNGVINVADTINPINGLPVKGPVVIGGTISPGTSPGRLRINCDLTMLSGSKLILEIDDNGVSVDIDQLIIGETSNFDLFQTQIIFSFLGSTNPETVDLNLNRFLRAGATGSDETTGLQRLFKVGDDWNDIVNSRNFAFQSTVYDVSSFEFNAATGGITGVEASAIPEPATYALVLLALGLLAATARRRGALRR